MNQYRLVLLACLVFVLNSCKTKEKTSGYNYMQNAEQLAVDASAKNASATIQPGDQLSIVVSAKNMEVAKPFNQTYYSSQNSLTPGSASTNVKSEISYTVNSDGTIDFPVLGSVLAANISLEELKQHLTTKIEAYIKNPSVSVKLTNFKVTVLGEVGKPGQYTMIDVVNPTVLNALGMASDLTMYGRRDNILIVRNVGGQITKERLNILDASFINSPYYHLKQGDVIYVSANETREKTSRLDPNTSIYIAVAGTLIGLAGIFITIFKK